MSSDQPQTDRVTWRDRLHEIIFEADTPAGKLFDVVLLLAILLSLVVLSLETVASLDAYHSTFVGIEWGLTILFSIEFALRVICVRRPLRYVLSFYGIVDILAILPTYLAILFPGTQSLSAIRSLRLLRTFRVFKLGRMLSEASDLRRAVWHARSKVVVFLTTVLIVVAIAGPTMYLVENLKFGDAENAPDLSAAGATGGPIEDASTESQFTSIPQAMYWAVVTMTTVGYGDIVPRTVLGKLLSSLLIMVGYSLIIVPTGFVSAELIHRRTAVSTQSCPSCLAEGHDLDAICCKICGAKL